MVSVLRLRPLPISFIAILLTFPGLPAAASSSSGEAPATEQTSENVSEPEGIPITSELVWEACGSCHQLDDQNRMSRISYMRATPEGWQHKMRRMMGLNGLEIEPKWRARSSDTYRTTWASPPKNFAPRRSRPSAA